MESRAAVIYNRIDQGYDPEPISTREDAMSTSSTKTPPEIHYPESDGKPMGETGIHIHTNMEIFGTLKGVLFKDAPGIYVTADMFFYYEEGNPKAVKSPDVMFIRGVQGSHERRTYKLWVENAVPCVIFEITSKDTRREDTVTKHGLYARLGVHEYFLFDPLSEYLNPQLRGFRLEGDRYEPIPSGPDGVLESLHLGLKLQAEGTAVRLIDPLTDEPIPSIFELPGLAEDRRREIEALERDLNEKRKLIDRERRKGARESRKAEAERRKAAEERQQAAAARANAEVARANAEAERANAEVARANAEAERANAEAWKAEVERLKALLRERGADDSLKSVD